MATGGTGLHVGLIGVGRIGAFHLRTLASLEDVAGLTVTDADPQRAESVAAGARHAVAPSPEALVEAGVDAIVIATPTPTHAPLLRLVADAGIPAFCEK